MSYLSWPEQPPQAQLPEISKRKTEKKQCKKRQRERERLCVREKIRTKMSRRRKATIYLYSLLLRLAHHYKITRNHRDFMLRNDTSRTQRKDEEETHKKQMEQSAYL